MLSLISSSTVVVAGAPVLGNDASVVADRATEGVVADGAPVSQDGAEVVLPQWDAHAVNIPDFGNFELDGYRVSLPKRGVFPHLPAVPDDSQPKTPSGVQLSISLGGLRLLGLPLSREKALSFLKMRFLPDTLKRDILMAYNWEGCNMDECFFPRDMNYVQLSGAILGSQAVNRLLSHSRNISFSGASLKDVVIKGLRNLSTVSFESAHFDNVTFEGSFFRKCNFKNVQVVRGLKFSRCHFQLCSFENLQADQLDFVAGRSEAKNITKCSFRGAKIGRLTLENLGMINTQLVLGAQNIQNISMQSVALNWTENGLPFVLPENKEECSVSISDTLDVTGVSTVPGQLALRELVAQSPVDSERKIFIKAFTSREDPLDQINEWKDRFSSRNDIKYTEVTRRSDAL